MQQVSLVQPVIRPDRVHQDPVGFWLDRLRPSSRRINRWFLERLIQWLRQQPKWETVTPRELLIRHLEAEDQYVVLDLVQQWIGTLRGRRNTKLKAYSAIYSYFAHNRCALPRDPGFRIMGDTPPVRGQLTEAQVRHAALAATIKYRSIILFRWQSFLDMKGLLYVNENCADEIVQQIRDGTRPIIMHLPGRKRGRNDAEAAFFTFIGKDAVDALVEYFDKDRGCWPNKGEPIWIHTPANGIANKRVGKPISERAVYAMWLRLLRRMGKIPKARGKVGEARYGLNLHEMRDAASTYLHTHAKGEGLDLDCVELWCGHVGQIDPLKYDKFYQDVDYVRNQYRIAEKHLNIISGQTGAHEEAAKKAVMAVIKAQYGDKLPAEKLNELERILPMTQSADELAKKAMNFAIAARAEDEPAARSQPKKPPSLRSKTTPSTPAHAPYETLIVSEEDLVARLNEGYDIARELRNGRIIIRKPLDHLEAVSVEA